MTKVHRGSDSSVTTDVLGIGNRPFQESILIRDGYYCGRRFDAGSLEAVWFLEEDQVKISDVLGTVLCVLRGSEVDALAALSLPEAELPQEQFADQPADMPQRRAA